jgi:hypothetical protein
VRPGLIHTEVCQDARVVAGADVPETWESITKTSNMKSWTWKERTTPRVLSLHALRHHWHHYRWSTAPCQQIPWSTSSYWFVVFSLRNFGTGIPLTDL